MAKTLNFIDLFSGCGGFSHGMEKAGLNCLLGVDYNKEAIETFKLNHKNASTYCGDILKLNRKKIDELIESKKIDIIIGGPPCQGFSTAGRGDADDPRNALFKQFVKIVSWYKPKVIVLENVTGLLAKKNEPTLKKIFQSFKRIGYNLEAQVMSSQDYGVPEKRRRTIMIGVLKEIGLPVFPSKTHGENLKKVVDVKKAFSKLYKYKKLTSHNTETATIKNEIDMKRLKYIPPGRGIRYKRDENELLPKRLHYNVKWDEIREGRFRQTRLQRLDPDRPSYTILTSRTMYIHPYENRYLTAREAAYLQSFPVTFKFSGSLTSQFRQIGNAVPVEMAKKIGLCVIGILCNKQTKVFKKHNFEKMRSKAFSYKVS